MNSLAVEGVLFFDAIIAPMQIYFSGAIAGGRDNLPIYQHIVSRLKALGHTIPTEHVADPNVLADERVVEPRVVYARDVKWIDESDAMIADISTPSLGVGFEIGYALQRNMPVLCVHRAGLFVSKMITGHPSPQLAIAIYHDTDELDRHIDAFLQTIHT